MRKLKKLFRLVPHKKFRHGLYHGVAAAIEHQDLIKSLNITHCIDIGANIGQFSLAIRKIHPEAKIIAFEPLENPARKYNQLFSDDELCMLYRYAVGSSKASSSMNVSKSIDSSSLLSITETQNDLFPGTQKIHEEQVNIDTLDRFVSVKDLEGSALMKVDVQGYEMEVLQGAKSLLSNIKWIYVEASYRVLYEGQTLAADIVNFLSENNFRLTGVYNTSYDAEGLAIQSDFLFINNA